MLRHTRSRPSTVLAALLVVVALLAAACGNGSGGRSEDRTVRVWLMQHSVAPGLVERVVRDFESRHPGTTVEVTEQRWDGIGAKVNKALDSDEAPDVIEVGNTQVAQYVAGGGVRNLTLEVFDLGGDDWISGLAEPGRIDGYQYGIPYYAANRVVIYRKDRFAEAGIDTPPADRAQWLAATRRLHRPDEGRQGIYLPGQNWYVLAGFIWDEGGDLAVEQSGSWSGALDTPEALRGMDFYRTLQAYGSGPADADEADPEQAEVFAEGESAQLITVPGQTEQILEANPKLEGKLGFFPIPGKKAKTPGSVFTGGSVLIIPERAREHELGYEFLKLITGDRWQREIARTMSYVPNRASLADALDGDPGAEAMAVGAEQGHATPNSPAWAALEARNPIKSYQTAVLTGGDPATAAREASREITSLLGTGNPAAGD